MVTQTAWKLSKHGVVSGPYFPIFGPNTGKYRPGKTPKYLETFHTVMPVSVIAVLWKLLILFVRITSMEVPQKKLKNVLLLIKYRKEYVSHTSDS